LERQILPLAFVNGDHGETRTRREGAPVTQETVEVAIYVNHTRGNGHKVNLRVRIELGAEFERLVPGEAKAGTVHLRKRRQV